MSIIKRLFIKVSNSYDSNFQIVPVNTEQPIEIKSDIGVFKLIVNIKKFDGAKPHLSNSLYNIGDKKFLNNESIDYTPKEITNCQTTPNLRINIEYTPNQDIKGGELLFGNDFTYPIKDYVPTTLLSTGLKLFNWFINNTVKGDIYNEKPFLYGLALNSFTYLGINESKPELVSDSKKGDEPVNSKENLNLQNENIPTDSIQRKKYFNTVEKCNDEFNFKKDQHYNLQFDTDFLKLGDSKYSVAIPTFDIDVGNYANETLNNVNWVVKKNGYDGVGQGELGLIINFALLDEEKEDTE
ncbi:unnamed protein product [Candida verbasci]|uniref:Domain of unknown function at the cortex 1 domain-containing protein n=1 Tax=Candida verbasci TaxID=1227364 RepID=A0A9W4XJF7_9ASCO|nr:unnamed protein product [Candida verbasci]